MSLRERNGKWHWRFKLDGTTWSGPTELAATKRNEAAARDEESAARRLIKDGGKPGELRVQVTPFCNAADAFVEWAKGEHRDKPNTWKRLRGSCTALKLFYGKKPLQSITVGLVEDFKSWRRKDDVAEVTIRHDMHTLGPIFEYGQKHGWCTRNPVEGVEIPSDKDAVRFHLVTPAEELVYFEAAKRNRDLRDVARLMLLQGPRPSEVMSAHVRDVDLAAAEWKIPDSKSRAGRRILHLVPESRDILATRVASVGPSGWLFAGKKPGTHLVDVQNGHMAVLEATGLAFVLYDFRHSFATRMAANGCDIATLAAILGHANLRTVQRYIHIGREEQKAAMLKYGAGVVEKVEERKELVQ